MKRHDPLLEDWDRVLSYLARSLGIYDPDLEGILFVIGVNIVGKGPEKFNKREKTEIIHVAVCELLEPYGFYQRIAVSEDGWPDYRVVKPLPILSIVEQERLLKMAVIDYFRREGLINGDY